MHSIATATAAAVVLTASTALSQAVKQVEVTNLPEVQAVEVMETVTLAAGLTEKAWLPPRRVFVPFREGAEAHRVTYPGVFMRGIQAREPDGGLIAEAHPTTHEGRSPARSSRAVAARTPLSEQRVP